MSLWPWPTGYACGASMCLQFKMTTVEALLTTCYWIGQPNLAAPFSPKTKTSSPKRSFGRGQEVTSRVSSMLLNLA